MHVTFAFLSRVLQLGIQILSFKHFECHVSFYNAWWIKSYFDFNVMRNYHTRYLYWIDNQKHIQTWLITMMVWILIFKDQVLNLVQFGHHIPILQFFRKLSMTFRSTSIQFHVTGNKCKISLSLFFKGAFVWSLNLHQNTIQI